MPFAVALEQRAAAAAAAAAAAVRGGPETSELGGARARNRPRSSPSTAPGQRRPSEGGPERADGFGDHGEAWPRAARRRRRPPSLYYKGSVPSSLRAACSTAPHVSRAAPHKRGGRPAARRRRRRRPSAPASTAGSGRPRWQHAVALALEAVRQPPRARGAQPSSGGGSAEPSSRRLRRLAAQRGPGARVRGDASPAVPPSPAACRGCPCAAGRRWAARRARRRACGRGRAPGCSTCGCAGRSKSIARAAQAARRVGCVRRSQWPKHVKRPRVEALEQLAAHQADEAAAQRVQRVAVDVLDLRLAQAHAQEPRTHAPPRRASAPSASAPPGAAGTYRSGAARDLSSRRAARAARGRAASPRTSAGSACSAPVRVVHRDTRVGRRPPCGMRAARERTAPKQRAAAAPRRRAARRAARPPRSSRALAKLCEWKKARSADAGASAALACARSSDHARTLRSACQMASSHQTHTTAGDGPPSASPSAN